MSTNDTTSPTAFFEQHAGYARQPDESDDQARARCATDLVNAEQWVRSSGVTFDWSDDWHVTDHQSEYDCYADGGPTTCETCTCYGADGTILASLSCIDDATPEYRRVVEAELASEAMDVVDQDSPVVTSPTSTAVQILATSALWYAWGQIDGRADLRADGFTTDHGHEFQRYFEQLALDYEQDRRSFRPSVLDAWNRYVEVKRERGLDVPPVLADLLG